MGLEEITGPPTNNRSIEGLSSCKVEEFSFAVLHNEASIEEDFRHNIVVTEKKGRR